MQSQKCAYTNRAPSLPNPNINLQLPATKDLAKDIAPPGPQTPRSFENSQYDATASPRYPRQLSTTKATRRWTNVLVLSKASHVLWTSDSYRKLSNPGGRLYRCAEEEEPDSRIGSCIVRQDSQETSPKCGIVESPTQRYSQPESRIAPWTADSEQALVNMKGHLDFLNILLCMQLYFSTSLLILAHLKLIELQPAKCVCIQCICNRLNWEHTFFLCSVDSGLWLSLWNTIGIHWCTEKLILNCLYFCGAFQGTDMSVPEINPVTPPIHGMQPMHSFIMLTKLI